MTGRMRKNSEVSVARPVRKRFGPPVAVTLKIPFHDCDPLHVVWHGRYLQYMEIARSALLRSRQLDVEHVRDMGYKMFITEARCRYLAPLTYNDEVQVTARFTGVTPILRVSYDIVNITRGRKSARAFTTLAVTDFHDNLKETPDDILSRLESSLEV